MKTKTAIALLLLVLLLTYTYATKEATKKNRKSKLYAPQLDCDTKAAKIINPEFIAKCPAGCHDAKYRVYGTDVYAAFSSVCGAAIHSGMIDKSGGKILVQKVSGQSGYKGSFSNGIRSLSLPRWKESFIVSEGKPKKGVQYPSTLEYLSSRNTSVKGDKQDVEDERKLLKTVFINNWYQLQDVELLLSNKGQEPKHFLSRGKLGSSLRKAYLTTKTPFPVRQVATSTSEPTIMTTELVSTTLKPTTVATTIPTTVVIRKTSVPAAKSEEAIHKARNNKGSSNIHSVYTPVASVALRQVQAVQAGMPNQAFRDTSIYASNRNIPRANTGIQRQEPSAAFRKPASSPVSLATEAELWKPGAGLFNSGFVSKEDSVPKPLEPVSQGNSDCKVDLAFLIDGSWSIGKRRFQIQKQFLKDVSHTLDVGMAGPLMGIIQYGDDASTEFHLKTYANSKDLKNAIEKILQKGGLSNVGRALSFVNKNFFEDTNGNRGSAPNVVVVMVDGWPTDKVEEASRLARESGINIFFVTIEGPDENEKQNVIELNFVEKAVCRTNGYYSINVPSWFSLHKIVQPLVKRICDSDRLVCSKTCLNSADLGFVIDGSSSVGTGNFRTILQFIANISKEFEISDTDTRVGAVQYTYEQRLEFGFNKFSTKQDVLNAIKRINYWSGGTSTGAAINYAFEQLFSKSKPNKRKLMILITDGRSYDDVQGPAAAAHQNGVIAYSVGIAWAAQDELEAVATDPDKDHSFFVDEFDSLYRFVPRIIQNICTEFNSQPRN